MASDKDPNVVSFPEEWFMPPLRLAEDEPPTDEEEIERISKRYSS